MLFQDLPGVLAIYELRERVRNPRHPYFGDLQTVLQNAALIDENGSVPPVIQEVVLAALEGESLEMRLVPPL